jgi:hypothetical protein
VGYSMIDAEDALFPFKFRSKWGFVDSAWRVVIEPMYDFVPTQVFSRRYPIPVYQGSKHFRYGYVWANGKLLIPFDLDFADTFSTCGFAVFAQRNKYSVLGSDGRICLSPNVEELCSFRNRRSPAKAGGKWGIIDTAGQWVIAPQYDSIESEHEGLILARMKGVWLFLDTLGVPVLRLAFGLVDNFSEGLAGIKLGDDFNIHDWGFVDKTGAIVIPCKLEYCKSFREGLASVRVQNKEGFIDHQGQFRIFPRFNTASEFCEGRALVSGDRGLYGFIDQSGRIAVDLRYDYACSFAHGVALVEQGEIGGYIDKDGKVIFWP